MEVTCFKFCNKMQMEEKEHFVRSCFYKHILVFNILHAQAWKNTLRAVHDCLSTCVSVGRVSPKGYATRMARAFVAYNLKTRSLMDHIVAQRHQTTLVQQWPKDTAHQRRQDDNAIMAYEMWCEEHLWNVDVIRRVHLPKLRREYIVNTWTAKIADGSTVTSLRTNKIWFLHKPQSHKNVIGMIPIIRIRLYSAGWNKN
jgi:hypothetical protein